MGGKKGVKTRQKTQEVGSNSDSESDQEQEALEVIESDVQVLQHAESDVQVIQQQTVPTTSKTTPSQVQEGINMEEILRQLLEANNKIQDSIKENKEDNRRMFEENNNKMEQKFEENNNKMEQKFEEIKQDNKRLLEEKFEENNNKLQENIKESVKQEIKQDLMEMKKELQANYDNSYQLIKEQIQGIQNENKVEILNVNNKIETVKKNLECVLKEHVTSQTKELEEVQQIFEHNREVFQERLNENDQRITIIQGKVEDNNGNLKKIQEKINKDLEEVDKRIRESLNSEDHVRDGTGGLQSFLGTGFLTLNNDMLPKYEGRHYEFPMVFLAKLDDFVENIKSESRKLKVVRITIKGNAETWFDMIRKKCPFNYKKRKKKIN